MSERPATPEPRFTAAVVACAFVGVAVVGVSLRSGFLASSVPTAAGPDFATEEYGRRLLAHTSDLLGPDHADPDKRYTGNRLACGSCHLGTGTEPGTLTLMLTTEHYPRFSARVGDKTEIEDRINECMQRSMNGRPLPKDSPEMIAMAAYIRSLGSRNQALGASKKKASEPAPFKTPARAASVGAGRTVFTERCAICHGAEGQGLLATSDRKRGYLFPPLWGPDSFNNGAGMNRVLTAARFIKARMPLGQADLTDDQAFDVAAFINDQPRPLMANLERDYPDLAGKPVDNGYGPFADQFPLEQHRFGPFAPIEEHYESLKKAKASK
jgi:thiosulfate dehydrogenase